MNLRALHRIIPGLQREPSWCCVSCGAAAELFCASCRVTPYCGERCQRRDWAERHRAICHNLAR
ncbi:Uncharacterized protein OBRU01_12218 [Operophtera brumata]|uniref:MYND-type domain-containing protein n=1 Tax=Operophtera brumata TaxID=104452 RepID=A0A0L7LAI8_OPEBR|nr:Uncharacterized protein OBRU01_12218 [Operophtera brumata]